MAGTPSSSRAGSSVVLMSTPVTLTNAQIKALPTTAITLVPAGGSGTMSVPLYAYVLSDLTAAYTGIDAAAAAPSIWIATASSPIYLQPFSDDVTPVTTLTVLLTTLNTFGALLFTVPPNLTTAGNTLVPGSNGGPADWDNLPLKIGSTNSINFTGGNAANTMDVTVLYTLVNT